MQHQVIWMFLPNLSMWILLGGFCEMSYYLLTLCICANVERDRKGETVTSHLPFIHIAFSHTVQNQFTEQWGLALKTTIPQVLKGEWDGDPIHSSSIRLKYIHLKPFWNIDSVLTDPELAGKQDFHAADDFEVSWGSAGGRRVCLYFMMKIKPFTFFMGQKYRKKSVLGEPKWNILACWMPVWKALVHFTFSNKAKVQLARDFQVGCARLMILDLCSLEFNFFASSNPLNFPCETDKSLPGRQPECRHFDFCNRKPNCLATFDIFP